MEKKNTLLLTVIAIATLLVAVVGATFAYFSSTQQATANIVTNVTTSSGTAAFTSTANNTSLSIVADSEWMKQGSDTVNKSQEGDITVSLVGASATETTTCTYDIVYQWTGSENTYDSGNSYYIPSSGVDKELTLQIGAPTPAANEVVVPSSITYATETNLTTGDSTNHKITLVDNAQLISAAAATVNAKWTFTLKFYNDNANSQDTQKGKTFAGKISLENVSCSSAITGS